MKFFLSIFLFCISLYSSILYAGEPKINPFRLPTFQGSGFDFRTHTPPIKKLKPFDLDKLFEAITNCYPEKSKFQGLKVNLQGGSKFANKSFDFDESGIASHYVGIVAEFPLFDSNDSSRERNWELQRRTNVASLLSKLKHSIAEREKAIRSLGLFHMLEARSKARVQEGIASTAEQVGHLEKVIEFTEKKEKSEANINEARLSLLAYCSADLRPSLNSYLKRLVHRGP